MGLICYSQKMKQIRFIAYNLYNMSKSLLSCISQFQYKFLTGPGGEPMTTLSQSIYVFPISLDEDECGCTCMTHKKLKKKKSNCRKKWKKSQVEEEQFPIFPFIGTHQTNSHLIALSLSHGKSHTLTDIHTYTIHRVFIF